MKLTAKYETKLLISAEIVASYDLNAILADFKANHWSAISCQDQLK